MSEARPRNRGKAIFRPLVLLLLQLLATAPARGENPQTVHIEFPGYRLQAGQLAVIVNDADPLSGEIAAYYRKARNIPEQNILHIRLDPEQAIVTEKEFNRVKADLDRDTPPGVQAYAITWISPHRVTCMSITSALTFGLDPDYCSSHHCATTAHNPYFRKPGTRPYSDLGIRPAMSIAAATFADARALIDRGVRSDSTQPEGTAYLVSTSDRARNVRAVWYPGVKKFFEGWIDTRIEQTDALRDRNDILFYFTGKAHVDHLDTLQFVPGAVADHLTSTGGILVGGPQMSALRWLEAGATGSYGTVVEPCNHRGKFPDPGILMRAYSHGWTLLEAYWQSVQQPGEGIFIGEPLAAPFDGYDTRVTEQGIQLHTRRLPPGAYRIHYAATPVGPYKPSPEILRVTTHQRQFKLPDYGTPYYRLTQVRRYPASMQ